MKRVSNFTKSVEVAVYVYMCECVCAYTRACVLGVLDMIYGMRCGVADKA